jgi:hypothetical protein
MAEFFTENNIQRYAVEEKDGNIFVHMNSTYAGKPQRA